MRRTDPQSDRPGSDQPQAIDRSPIQLTVDLADFTNSQVGLSMRVGAEAVCHAGGERPAIQRRQRRLRRGRRKLLSGK